MKNSEEDQNMIEIEIEEIEKDIIMNIGEKRDEDR